MWKITCWTWCHEIHLKINPGGINKDHWCHCCLLTANAMIILKMRNKTHMKIDPRRNVRVIDVPVGVSRSPFSSSLAHWRCHLRSSFSKDADYCGHPHYYEIIIRDHLTTDHHKIYERLTILALRLIMILAPVQPAPQDKENRANVKRPGVRIHLGRRTHLDDDDVYAMNMRIISQ